MFIMLHLLSFYKYWFFILCGVWYDILFVGMVNFEDIYRENEINIWGSIVGFNEKINRFGSKFIS